jgi:hypothetical protein
MRRLVLAAALAAVLVLPGIASAQDPARVCQASPDGSYQWQALLAPYFGTYWDRNGVHNPQGGASGAAKRALGAAQYSGVGYDNGYHGWVVIYATGALDETAARVAIRAEMATELSPDAVAFMDSKLRLVATKYSVADLEAVQSQIPATAADTGWNLGYGIGCTQTGAWGLELTRYAVKETPEVVAETEARFAQFGDKITLRYCDCVIAPAVLTAPAPATVVAPPPSTDRVVAPPRVGQYQGRREIGTSERGQAPRFGQDGAPAAEAAFDARDRHRDAQ